MQPPDVAVVDYGVGNLLSVRRGLESCGARVLVTGQAAEILAAPRVILPGVGAFASGMAQLRAAGLDRVVMDVARRGTPLLGICLGMQMLFDSSEEFGSTEGLGLIAGSVKVIPGVDTSGRPHKIPHIGWTSLEPAEGRSSWAGTLLDGVAVSEPMYFVHSYSADPADPADRLADAVYGGWRVAAVVSRANVAGCQFHPEKSGPAGLRILRNFVAS